MVIEGDCYLLNKTRAKWNIMPEIYKGVEYEIKSESEVVINGKSIKVIKEGGEYTSPEYAFMTFDNVEELVKKIIDNNPDIGKN